MSLYQDRYRIPSTRLPAWDYACAGYDFVTLCSRRHQPFQIPNTDLDEFVPDAPNTPKHLPAPGPRSAIIRSYKSAVTRWAGKNGYPHFAWQPRFYDHILRDDETLQSIRLYIQNNPFNWAPDRENPINITS